MVAWGRLEDQLFSDDKIQALLLLPNGHEAFVLHWAAICHANTQLTNGKITPTALATIALQAHVPTECHGPLHAVGLWRKKGENFWINKFLKYNRAAREVKAKRAWGASRSSMHRNSALIAAVRDRDGNICRYCGVKVRWTDRRGPTGATYDHVKPRGSNVIENLVVACRSCNAAKSNRTPDEAGMLLLGVGETQQEVEINQVRTKSLSNPVPSRPNPIISKAHPQPLVDKDGSTSPFMCAVMDVWPTAGALFYAGYARLEEDYGGELALAAFLEAQRNSQPKPAVRYIEAICERCQKEGVMPGDTKSKEAKRDGRPTETDTHHIVGWVGAEPVLGEPL